MAAYPPDVQRFVAQELASGDFASESEVVIEALRVYRELKGRHAALRNDVQRSIAQADRGETQPLDTDATKAEARRRLSRSE